MMTPISGRPIRLGVLISGGGTTLANLIAQITDGRLDAEIAVVIASRPDCGGLQKAREAGLRTHTVVRRDHVQVDSFSCAVFDRCREACVDLVVLAGFLCRLDIPDDFRARVMNIHPALIPAFCGKGMYGGHVHEAVLDRGCQVSGCTVHFADNKYDHGPIILQRCVPVLDTDTPDTLAGRVFEAECDAYPEAIRRYASGRLRICGRRVMLTQPGHEVSEQAESS